MKNSILLTSVLGLLILCANAGIAQHIGDANITVCATSPEMAKCVGAADCKACKNCSACAHCKENRGKCGVCRKARVASLTDEQGSTRDNDQTEVTWSSKSLKPAATTLPSQEVRSGPGDAFKLVGKISSNDPLIIIGERDGWYKIVVRHADLVGFVEAGYVEIVR